MFVGVGVLDVEVGGYGWVGNGFVVWRWEVGVWFGKDLVI